MRRTYTYDTDGNATTTGYGTGANPGTFIKFAGGHDIGSGLYHYGHRYYQPSIGRWTQQDPLMQPSDLGQANRYGYVNNDPLNATHPLGLKKRSWLQRRHAAGEATGGRWGVRGTIAGGVGGCIAGAFALAGPPGCAAGGAAGGTYLGVSSTVTGYVKGFLFDDDE